MLSGLAYASLIYFNYGDSKYKTLFQETLHLKKGMEGYDCKVLLKFESTPSWLDLSEKDEKLADIKDVPTKTNLFKYLIQLAEEGYFIDLFIFAHGDKGYFGQYGADEGTEHRVTSEDILDRLSPAKTGFVKWVPDITHLLRKLGRGSCDTMSSGGRDSYHPHPRRIIESVSKLTASAVTANRYSHE